MTDSELASDDELDDRQLAAMDSLWRAQRDGYVTPEQAAPIEALIRSGRTSNARRRLTEARRAGGPRQR